MNTFERYLEAAKKVKETEVATTTIEVLKKKLVDKGIDVGTKTDEEIKSYFNGDGSFKGKAKASTVANKLSKAFKGREVDGKKMETHELNPADINPNKKKKADIFNLKVK